MLGGIMKVKITKLRRRNDPMMKRAPSIFNGETYVGKLGVPSKALIDYWNGKGDCPSIDNAVEYVDKLEPIIGYPIFVGGFITGMRTSCIKSIQRPGTENDKLILPKDFSIEDEELLLEFLNGFEDDMLLVTLNSFYKITVLEVDL